MASADPVIPFGKFRGERASAVPVDYLDWLIGQDWMDEKPTLKEQIEQHLQDRPEWHRLGEED